MKNIFVSCSFNKRNRKKKEEGKEKNEEQKERAREKKKKKCRRTEDGQNPADTEKILNRVCVTAQDGAPAKDGDFGCHPFAPGLGGFATERPVWLEGSEGSVWGYGQLLARCTSRCLLTSRPGSLLRPDNPVFPEKPETWIFTLSKPLRGSNKIVWWAFRASSSASSTIHNNKAVSLSWFGHGGKSRQPWVGNACWPWSDPLRGRVSPRAGG